MKKDLPKERKERVRRVTIGSFAKMADTVVGKGQKERTTDKVMEDARRWLDG